MQQELRHHLSEREAEVQWLCGKCQAATGKAMVGGLRLFFTKGEPGLDFALFHP